MNKSIAIYLRIFSLFFILFPLSDIESYGVPMIGWSDDFEDENYDGWTIEDGVFTTGDKMLKAAGTKSDHHRIKHSSNESYGTWNVDVHLNTSVYITAEHLYLNFLMEEFGQLGVEKGYFVILWLYPLASVVLVKRVEGNEILGSYDYNTSFSPRQHITITRTQKGHFNVFVNGSLVIEAMDNNMTKSNYYGFDTPGTHSFDNITIDNEISIWPVISDRANLKFVNDHVSVSCQQNRSATTSISIENTGKATGYGQLTPKSVPSGISIDFIGPDMVTNIQSESSSQRTVSTKVEASVTPGNYEAIIELSNSTTVLDTLSLNITVIKMEEPTSTPSSTSFSSFVFISIVSCVLIVLYQQKRKNI